MQWCCDLWAFLPKFALQNLYKCIKQPVKKMKTKNNQTKNSLIYYKRENGLLLPSMQQQPGSLSSGSFCLWREEVGICSPRAKSQGRGELAFRGLSSHVPKQMRNEVANSYSTAPQCIFSDHLTRCPLLIRFKNKGPSLPRSKSTIRECVCSLRYKTRKHSTTVIFIIKDQQLLLWHCTLLVSPA